MGKLINGVWVDWIDKVKILQKALLVRSDGRILALKRVESAHIRPECWDLPGGALEPEQIAVWKDGSGKGDSNDILVQSISAEIAEETGLLPARISAIHSASGFDDKKGVFIVAIGYICEVPDTAKLQLSSEHSEHKWVTPDEFQL